MDSMDQLKHSPLMIMGLSTYHETKLRTKKGFIQATVNEDMMQQNSLQQTQEESE